MREAPAGPGFSRRQFLARTGMAGAFAVALAEVPALLRLRGWDDPVYARDADLVHDTLNGLVAFILPGSDDYSVAQGEHADGPGGIAAGTTDVLITNIDRFLPSPNFPGGTVPLSGAIANLLNTVALTVNPAAANGAFVSPFARLSFSEKAKVFRTLEEDSRSLPDDQLPEPFTQGSGNFAFVAGILPGFVAYLSGTEVGVFDSSTRSLRSKPVGWQISGYQPNGPVQGWDEFKGYWQGRRQVTR